MHVHWVSLQSVLEIFAMGLSLISILKKSIALSKYGMWGVLHLFTQEMPLVSFWLLLVCAARCEQNMASIFLMMEPTFPFTLRQVTWLLASPPLFFIFILVLLAFQLLVNIKSFHKKYQENKPSLLKRRLLAVCFSLKIQQGL